MRKLLRPRFVASLAVSTLLATLPACAGSNEDGTKAPKGKSQAQVDAERAEAMEAAKAQGLLDLANEELGNGRYMSAIRRAEEALAADEKNADAHAIIGAAKWRAGDVEASTAAFEKALEIDPKNFGAAQGLGRNLQAMGDHARALELQDALIATESEGFKEGPCNEDGTCDEGVCNAEKICKPPMQVAPRLVKLWSQYLLLDMKAANQTVDEIFLGVGADEGSLGLVNAYAEIIRPLSDKGPFAELEGKKGSTDLALDATQGVKHISSVVKGQYARAVVLELQDESRINPEFAETLGLKPVAEVTPPGSDEKVGLVLIPEIEIKGVKIKNVPALVQDLSAYEGSVGEMPGIVIGRQVLQKFGAVEFDFPAGVANFHVDAPDAPAGANELPLLMLDLHVLHVPATKMSIDGSGHTFWAWVGGVYGSAVALTKKAYLKSQHRPSEVDPPDDPNQGLKMVYIDQFTLGEQQRPGGGALVLTNTPPDQGLGNVVEGTAFELGGYVNVARMKNWKLYYLFPQGKIWIDAPKAEVTIEPASGKGKK